MVLTKRALRMSYPASRAFHRRKDVVRAGYITGALGFAQSWILDSAQIQILQSDLFLGCVWLFDGVGITKRHSFPLGPSFQQPGGFTC